MDDSDFASEKLVWSTWLHESLELWMTRGTERQRRQGRKHIREMNTMRVLVKQEVASKQTKIACGAIEKSSY